MEKVKDYFNRYPHSREVYENGGLLFHDRGSADSYGKGETKKYDRKEVLSPVKETAPKGKKETLKDE